MSHIEVSGITMVDPFPTVNTLPDLRPTTEQPFLCFPKDGFVYDHHPHSTAPTTAINQDVVGNEITLLSAKLIDVVNLQTSLENNLQATRKRLQAALARANAMEVQNEMLIVQIGHYQSRISSGEFVTHEHVLKLESELTSQRAATNEVAKRKRDIERELEELSESVFTIANCMVSEERKANEQDRQGFMRQMNEVQNSHAAEIIDMQTRHLQELSQLKSEIEADRPLIVKSMQVCERCCVFTHVEPSECEGADCGAGAPSRGGLPASKDESGGGQQRMSQSPSSFDDHDHDHDHDHAVERRQQQQQQQQHTSRTPAHDTRPQHHDRDDGSALEHHDVDLTAQNSRPVSTAQRRSCSCSSGSSSSDSTVVSTEEPQQLPTTTTNHSVEAHTVVNVVEGAAWCDDKSGPAFSRTATTTVLSDGDGDGDGRHSAQVVVSKQASGQASIQASASGLQASV